LHNTLASLLNGISGLVIGTVFDWTGWLLMIVFIIWAIYREKGYLVRYLFEEVNLGRITGRQYKTACSAWSQGWTRFNALFSGNYQPTNRFYQLCGELAHKKHQIQILGEEGGNTHIIQALQDELARLSPLAM
jgi:hypothetical protein